MTTFLLMYCIGFCLIYVVIGLGLVKKSAPTHLLTSFPMVSVLVACRNEETNIGDCLQALASQDYPRDRMEILVGNDQSTDGTSAILATWRNRFPPLRVLELSDADKPLPGKPGVLAVLAHQAKGEIFLITDADVMVNTRWISTLVEPLTKGCALVTGTTLMETPNRLARFQQYDWSFYIGILHGMENLGIATTTMGNNMGVTRAAYEATGGYENIPFSITEDLQLFIEVKKRGGAHAHLMEPGSLGVTRPQPDYPSLIKQRHRWLMGAKGLPVLPAMFLLYCGAYPVMLLFALIFQPIIVPAFLLVKTLLEIGIRRRVAQLTSYAIAEKDAWLHGIWSWYFGFHLIIALLSRRKVIWKGRQF